MSLKNIEVVLRFKKATKGTVVYELDEGEDENFRSNSIYLDKGAFEDLNNCPEFIKVSVSEIEQSE